MEATRNKCHATRNKCLTSSNKKLLETRSLLTLMVTGPLSMVTGCHGISWKRGWLRGIHHDPVITNLSGDVASCIGAFASSPVPPKTISGSLMMEITSTPTCINVCRCSFLGQTAKDTLGEQPMPQANQQGRQVQRLAVKLSRQTCGKKSQHNIDKTC